MPESSTQQTEPSPLLPLPPGEGGGEGSTGPVGRLLRSPVPDWLGIAAAGILAAGVGTWFLFAGGGEKAQPKPPPAAATPPKRPPVQPPAGDKDSADAAFNRLRDEGRRLSAVGDYDGALVELGKPPEKFAAALAPRLQAEAAAVRRQAEGKFGAALAEARKLGEEGRPVDGLKKLDAVSREKYAALAGRIAELRAELEGQMFATLGVLFRAPGKTDSAAARPPRGPTVYTKWPFDAAEAKRRQEETADSLGLPVEHVLDLGKGVKLELVLIPAGEFMMGGEIPADELLKKGGEAWWGAAGTVGPGGIEHEFPQHKVRLTRAYYLGKYEVTQEQWDQVMGDRPSYFKGMRRPVEQVNRDDCQAFTKKLVEKSGGKVEFRLPTEKEWEHACRAGTATPFWFGDQITTDMANYNGEPWDGQGGTDRNETVAVGSFRPNPWGLYDTVGNVWEWCEDWYEAYGQEALTNPQYLIFKSFCVERGGSWRDFPTACRSASRGLHCPLSRYHFIGLRVLVAVPSPAAR